MNNEQIKTLKERIKGILNDYYFNSVGDRINSQTGKSLEDECTDAFVELITEIESEKRNDLYTQGFNGALTEVENIIQGTMVIKACSRQSMARLSEIKRIIDNVRKLIS